MQLCIGGTARKIDPHKGYSKLDVGPMLMSNVSRQFVLHYGMKGLDNTGQR